MVRVLDKGVRYPFATKSIHPKSIQHGKYNDLVKGVNVTPLLTPLLTLIKFFLTPFLTPFQRPLESLPVIGFSGRLFLLTPFLPLLFFSL